MILEYNSKQYVVTDDSIYTDFSIVVSGLDEAVSVVNELSNMTSYTFDIQTNCANMIAKKVAIVIEGGVTAVRMQFRPQTDLERTRAEIEEMRSAIQEIPVSEADAAKHPCLFPDISTVDKVIPGNYYIINGVVSLVTDAIDEDVEGQYVSRPVKGGK